uniref:Uncharacterized protein n=1 Tax=Strongyloides venezuelensis TaxID=75913 RepID=A0A0K0FY62_STRVS
MSDYPTISYYNYQSTTLSNTLSTFDSSCPSICSSCPNLQYLNRKISHKKNYESSQQKNSVFNGIKYEKFYQNNHNNKPIINDNKKSNFFEKTCYNESYKKPGTFVQTILVKNNHKATIINNKNGKNKWHINGNELSRVVYPKPNNKTFFYSSKCHINRKLF